MGDILSSLISSLLAIMGIIFICSITNIIIYSYLFESDFKLFPNRRKDIEKIQLTTERLIYTVATTLILLLYAKVYVAIYKNTVNLDFLSNKEIQLDVLNQLFKCVFTLSVAIAYYYEFILFDKDIYDNNFIEKSFDELVVEYSLITLWIIVSITCVIFIIYTLF